jgi:hypothetical protein
MTRILPLVARVLLGLVFFVFGLNGFFHFLPMSRRMEGARPTFMGALAATGYMFPLIKGIEVARRRPPAGRPLRPARARAARADRRQHRRVPRLPDPRRGRHVRSCSDLPARLPRLDLPQQLQRRPQPERRPGA